MKTVLAYNDSLSGIGTAAGKDDEADLLKENIDPNWKSGADPVAYMMFDFSTPHCSDAEQYRTVFGKVRYRCKHSTQDLQHGAPLGKGH